MLRSVGGSAVLSIRKQDHGQRQRPVDVYGLGSSSPFWRTVSCSMGLGSPSWGQRVGGSVLGQGLEGFRTQIAGWESAAQLGVNGRAVLSCKGELWP